jgi:membrane protein YdbS with pleckstrin-like domain
VPTGKLIALMLGWVLASVMIALVTAIVVVEVLRLLGIAESGKSGYTLALNAVFGVVLAVLVAVPFLFRRRFNTYERPPDA